MALFLNIFIVTSNSPVSIYRSICSCSHCFPACYRGTTCGKADHPWQPYLVRGDHLRQHNLPQMVRGDQLRRDRPYLWLPRPIFSEKMVQDHFFQGTKISVIVLVLAVDGYFLFLSSMFHLAQLSTKLPAGRLAVLQKSCISSVHNYSVVLKSNKFNIMSLHLVNIAFCSVRFV